MEHQDISDFLRADSRFTKRRKWLIFSELVFEPTGEKVEEGFRYFTCSADELMQAFSARDIASIAKLPFALDEDGEPDTSAVCLDIAYTPSGAFVAAQPTEYRDHVPTRIAPVIFLEGAEAQALKDVMPSLDQSS